MKPEDYLIVPVIDIDGEISDKKFLPYRIVSSSVSGGYNDISSSLSSSFAIVDNHTDTYANFTQAPMQGPYTEKYVGGEFHRHQNIATEDTNISNRQEGYFIEYAQKAIITRTPATEGNIGEGNLVPASTQLDDNVRAMTPYRREEFTKRPISIKNIQHTTGSTIVGNYDKPLDYFSTTGKKENNLWFRDFTGSINNTQDIIAFSQKIGQPLDRDFELPRKQRNENVISSRFSAPGEKETLSRGYMDQVSQEYSSYNSINFRNRIFKNNLQKSIKGESDSSLIENQSVKVPPSYLTDAIAQLANNYNWRLLYARNTGGSAVIDLSGNGDDATINGSTYTWDASPQFGGLDQLGLDFDASPSYVIKNSLSAINTNNEKMLIVSHTRDNIYTSSHRFSEIIDTAGDRLLLYSTAGDNLALFDGTTVHETAWLPRQNENVLLAGGINGSNVQLWANGYLLKEAATVEDYNFAASFDYSFGVAEDGGSRTGGQYGFAGLLDQTLTNTQKVELFKTIMGRDTIYYWDYLVENIDSGLTVHWPFFETQSTTTIIADVSQGEIHGSVSAGTFANGDSLVPVFSSGAYLDTSTEISVTSEYDPSSRAFTIEFWYRPDVSSIGVEGALWSFGTTGNFISILKTSLDRIEVYADDGTNQESVVSSVDITSGVTYRINMYYNPETRAVVFYVNDTQTESLFGAMSFASMAAQPMTLNNAPGFNRSAATYNGLSLVDGNAINALQSFNIT